LVDIPLDTIGVAPANPPGTQDKLRCCGFDEDLEWTLFGRQHNIIRRLTRRCTRLIQWSRSDPNLGLDTHHRRATVVLKDKSCLVTIQVVCDNLDRRRRRDLDQASLRQLTTVPFLLYPSFRLRAVFCSKAVIPFAVGFPQSVIPLAVSPCRNNRHYDG
jgi:hypothetical protein